MHKQSKNGLGCSTPLSDGHATLWYSASLFEDVVIRALARILCPGHIFSQQLQKVKLNTTESHDRHLRGFKLLSFYFIFFFWGGG